MKRPSVHERTGIDFGRYGPDEELAYIENDAVQSATESLTVADPDRRSTIREVARWVGIGGLGPLVAGTPAQVADALEEWVADTDVDGFNLAYVLAHDTFREVVELLIPELQRRGVFKKEDRQGTLCEKLFGRGPRLPGDLPGAAFRMPALEAAMG